MKFSTDASYQVKRNLPNKSNFVFRKRYERIDWRMLASVDVDRLTQNVDFNALQAMVSQVTFCNIEAEVDVRSIDNNFLKLFKLSQLMCEYLLFSQEYLRDTILTLESKLSSAVDAMNALQDKNTALEKTIKDLKADVKKRKEIIKELQSKAKVASSDYIKCSYCSKIFLNDFYLDAHMMRRHPELIKGETNNTKVEELESTIFHLKERLNLKENALDEARQDNFMKIFKSQQEKTDLLHQEIKNLHSKLESKHEAAPQPAPPRDDSLQIKLLESHIVELEDRLRSVERNKVEASFKPSYQPVVNYSTPVYHDSPKKKAPANKPVSKPEVRPKKSRSMQKPIEEVYTSPSFEETDQADQAYVSNQVTSFSAEDETSQDLLDDPTSLEANKELSPNDLVKWYHQKKIHNKVAEYSETDVSIPFTYSHTSRLTNALVKDPHLLEKLKPDLENLVNQEMAKRGIDMKNNRVEKKDFEKHLRQINNERAQLYKKTPGLRKLHDEYSSDVTKIVEERITSKSNPKKTVRVARRLELEQVPKVVVSKTPVNTNKEVIQTTPQPIPQPRTIPTPSMSSTMKSSPEKSKHTINSTYDFDRRRSDSGSDLDWLEDLKASDQPKARVPASNNTRLQRVPSKASENTCTFDSISSFDDSDDL